MRIVSARERFAAPIPSVPVVKAPGRGQENPGYGRKNPLPSPVGTQGPHVAQDWRNGNGGAFHSDVRPPMSSDIPHPSDIFNDPKSKRHQNALARTVGASEDPEHDPWNVLGGTGQTFEGLVQNHMSHQQNMSPDQAYAGRVWYQAAHDATKDLAAKTTGHHGKAVAVMSAYSPKTGWDENMEKGHHFLTNYRGVDPTPDNPQGIDHAWTQPGMGPHTEAAKAIFHSKGDGWKEALTGPKRSAFANNILDPTQLREPRQGAHDDAGYYQHPMNQATGEPDWRLHADQDSTIDTHHVRMSNTPHGADLGGLKYETPNYFGKKVSDGQGGKFDPSYDLHSRAAWEATRRINAAEPDPAKHLVPKQVQAGPWTKFKADVDAAGKGAGTPEPGTRPQGLLDEFDKKKNVGRDPQEVEQGWGEKNPLTNPIPRYERDISSDWWDDPRRPQVNLRQSPNWMRRSSLSPWWDSFLQQWIQRNPQHPPMEDRVLASRSHLAAYDPYGVEGPGSSYDNPLRSIVAPHACPHCGGAFDPSEMDEHIMLNHDPDAFKGEQVSDQALVGSEYRYPAIRQQDHPMNRLNSVDSLLAQVDGLLNP